MKKTNDKMFLAGVTEESVCALRQKKEGRGHQRMKGWSVGFRGQGSGGTAERDTFGFAGGRTQRSSILRKQFVRFPVGDPFEHQHIS